MAIPIILAGLGIAAAILANSSDEEEKRREIEKGKEILNKIAQLDADTKEMEQKIMLCNTDTYRLIHNIDTLRLAFCVNDLWPTYKLFSKVKNLDFTNFEDEKTECVEKREVRQRLSVMKNVCGNAAIYNCLRLQYDMTMFEKDENYLLDGKNKVIKSLKRKDEQVENVLWYRTSWLSYNSMIEIQGIKVQTLRNRVRVAFNRERYSREHSLSELKKWLAECREVYDDVETVYYYVKNKKIEQLLTNLEIATSIVARISKPRRQQLCFNNNVEEVSTDFGVYSFKDIQMESLYSKRYWQAVRAVRELQQNNIIPQVTAGKISYGRVDYNCFSEEEQRNLYELWKSSNAALKMVTTPVISKIGMVQFSDFSKMYFCESDKELRAIENKFKEYTSLKMDSDIYFLFLGVALQVARQLIFEKIKKTDPEKRLSAQEGDKLVKSKEINYASKHKEYKEIVLGPVPYDATKGAGLQGIRMGGGRYHRLKTLGHDPVLGWIFGTMNILTDTCTLSDFSSWAINDMTFGARVSTVDTMCICMHMIQEDRKCLLAAIFKQAMHLKSDKHTKMGLPIPGLGVFNDNISEMIYRNYNSYVKADIGNTFSARFIDMFISYIHAMYYNNQTDGTLAMYKVRTDKIIMYADSIASGSNIIRTLITKNANKLDIGGILLSLHNIFSSVSFIRKLKEEFVNEKIKEAQESRLSQ